MANTLKARKNMGGWGGITGGRANCSELGLSRKKGKAKRVRNPLRRQLKSVGDWQRIQPSLRPSGQQRRERAVEAAHGSKSAAGDLRRRRALA